MYMNTAMSKPMSGERRPTVATTPFTAEAAPGLQVSCGEQAFPHLSSLCTHQLRSISTPHVYIYIHYYAQNHMKYAAYASFPSPYRS